MFKKTEGRMYSTNKWAFISLFKEAKKEEEQSIMTTRASRVNKLYKMEKGCCDRILDDRPHF